MSVPKATALSINASSGADTTLTMPGTVPGSGLNITRYIIQSRGGYSFRVGFASGDIAAGNYFTVSGGGYWEDSPSSQKLILYLRGDDVADTLEVMTWVD